ncbi:mismatch repair endonuclease PMS2-like [Corticium candelabrum]|uniref:mismatch repair endonuclease PMS2-like n=1 Tax=Corticium candelabrum TaxID=121492 RepID=UPI002E260CA4|nr:mismatch repair endonuclease PMS2-like [Corticium candelabrum]
MALKALDAASVHRLCSSQVIVSLQTAVKELIENSLDAGATRIEIDLKQYGSELIEVSDNGCGVEPSNFEGLTKRHGTSKLKEFSDLSSVTTLGFRGEALSSLCALSRLSLVTRHQSQSHATKIVMDSEGKIVEQTRVAREVGTTVTLENVFYSLPVRHREFMKNLKKEYGKLIQVVQGYCLISVGVRITCSHQASHKGGKQIVLSNGPSQSMKENIACVFGAKEMGHLIAMEQCSEHDIDISENKGLVPSAWPFRLIGFISKCERGSGRASPDRQFYYMNQRPVDLGKLSKTVNDVYHLYNKQQYPVVVLDIETERERVDVNLTPDKREIIIQQEKLLLLLVKYSLIKLFDKSNHAAVALQVSSQQEPAEGKEQLVAKDTLWKKFSSSRDRRKSLADFTVGGAPAKKVKKFDRRAIQQRLDKSLVSPAKPFMDPSFPESEIIDSLISNCNEVHLPLQEGGSMVQMESATLDVETMGGAAADRRALTVKCSTEMIRKRLNMQSATTGLSASSGSQFHARISSDANHVAERELQREFRKESFEKLEVIGQFNLGFIIAKLGSDLFIIDQHASDEKYNFERLQKTTVLEHQKLIVPKRLQLSAANEIILQDHVGDFARNGFTFSFDPEAEPGRRVHLTGNPVSKNWLFGAEDVDEMLFLLSDSSDCVCRPSRVSAMFASRACRSSVMVGTSLTKQSMKQILLHMGQLDQPWNCPHGRPTMRHLVNLSYLNETCRNYEALETK